MRVARSGDPAGELRGALVEALVELPLFDRLQNRADLIRLIRDDYPGYPDIAERPESRPHMIAVVLACLAEPVALHSFVRALRLLVGEQTTRRIAELVWSASLTALMPKADLELGRSLLRQAIGADDGDDVVATFDDLAAGPAIGDQEPAALTFADRTTAECSAGELSAWVTAQRRRFGFAPAAVPPPVPQQSGPQFDVRLRELVSAQLGDVQHPYQFFEGHVPALSRIYVEQRGETAGGVDGGKVLSVPQMLAGHRNVLIVSGPGMGKSTLVWKVQRDQAHWWLGTGSSGPDRDSAPDGLGRVLPLAIHAALFVERTPEQAVDEVARRLGCRESIYGLLEVPPAPGAMWMIMVDGIDEVLNISERSIVLHKIAAWIDRAGPAVRFVITTRPLPYGYLTDIRSLAVAEFSLKGFSPDDLAEFARQWFLARDPHQDVDGLVARFIDEVGAAGLRTLVQVPLLATIAALAFESDPNRPLPNNRAQLYEWFVMHLRYGRRSTSPDSGVSEPSRNPWERAWHWIDAHLVALLEHLADGHLERDPTPTVRRAEAWILANCPEPAIRQAPGLRLRIRGALTATSLLAEYGTDDVAFTHHSFAEFLAAGPRAEQFDERQWMSDLLSPHRKGLATFVLARRAEPADKLVRSLLDDIGEHIVLAGDIVAEGIEVAATLYKQVVEALIDQLTAEAEAAPEALRVLGLLARDAEVTAALAALVADGRVRPWVRATIADVLDQRDQGNRLRDLAEDRSLPHDVLWWAARRAGQAHETDAATDVLPPATVLSRHVLHRDLNDGNSSLEIRLEIAMRLAGWGESVGPAFLRRCFDHPAGTFPQFLGAARVLLDHDKRGHEFLGELLWSGTYSDEVRAAAALALAESQRAVRPGAPGRPVPVPVHAGLRNDLIDAMLMIPFMSSLADRRLLLNLLRRDVRALADVREHPEVRLHVLEIVSACVVRPPALWALRSALEIMAPEAVGCRRFGQIVNAVTLRDLIEKQDLERARDLLHRADAAATGESSLLAAFDRLAGDRLLAREMPSAVLFAGDTAKTLTGPLAVELIDWAERMADRFELEWPGTASPPEEPDVPGPETLSPHEVIDMDLWPPVATSEPRPSPRVWGEVPPRNPEFTGREEFLAALDARLRSTDAPQVLHGLGGAGKTQLAVEYVYRHAAEYDLVWWVPAEQLGQILTSLTRLAQRLGLAVTPEANSAVPAVLEALGTGGLPGTRWLLVFDAAEGPEEVRRFFPPGGDGRILITSRNLDWTAIVPSLEVDVFHRAESVEMLRRRVPQLPGEELYQLADALGDLPLAVEQAAAWLTTTGMPTGEYLALLEEKRLDILEVGGDSSYPQPVGAAWNVSLDRLRETNPAALHLLQVCAFLASEPISRGLLAGTPSLSITPELHQTLASPILLSRAIRDIQRLALARLDHRTNALQIHRLIKAVLVGQMSEEERVVRRREAHDILANGNPRDPERPAQWARYQELYPHVRESGAVESDEPLVRDLVYDVARYLFQYGDLAGSEAMAADALRGWEADLRQGDSATLRMAMFFTVVARALGRYEQAREWGSRILDLQLENFGPDDEQTLEAMSFAAADRRAMGDFADAHRMSDDVFERAQRLFGPDDPVTLQAAMSLTASLRLTGDFARAAELDADTYARCVAVLGETAGATLDVLDNLAVDQRELGDYLGAVRSSEESYRAYAEAFGRQAPGVLRSARNLAVAYCRAGNHGNAHKLATQTFEAFRGRYGNDHPDTIAAAAGMATDLRRSGQLEEAQTLAEGAVDWYARVFGASHPHTLAVKVNLALILRLSGDSAAARAVDEEALAQLTSALGADHPWTLDCAVNLASDEAVLGDLQSAYERDVATLQRLERVRGADHPTTLACRLNLALDLVSLGRAAESDALHGDAITSLRRVLGERHPATLNALRGIRADCDIDPQPL